MFRLAPKRTVLEVLTGQAWISDIQGALTVIEISECILLWDLLSEVAQQPGAEDSQISHFSAKGQYSTKTAYKGLFHGGMLFGPWKMN